MTHQTPCLLPCIVINRMFTGEYLKHSLGHEIINLYRADNGKFYLYLNSEGKLPWKYRNVSIMLMAKTVGNYTLEVVAKATNLKIAEGVLSEQIRFDSNCPNLQQVKYIQNENITYQGVDIIKIFQQNPYQSVYVTFETKNVIMPRSGRRIFIQFSKATKGSHGPGHYVRITGIGYPNSSLRNFVCPDGGKNQDYDTLMDDIINNHSLWDRSYPAVLPSICPEMQEEFIKRIDEEKLKD